MGHLLHILRDEAFRVYSPEEIDFVLKKGCAMALDLKDVDMHMDDDCAAVIYAYTQDCGRYLTPATVPVVDLRGGGGGCSSSKYVFFSVSKWGKTTQCPESVSVSAFHTKNAAFCGVLFGRARPLAY